MVESPVLSIEMESVCENILNHPEFHWVSSGKVVDRFVKLKDELHILLLQERSVLYLQGFPKMTNTTMQIFFK